MRGPDIKQSAMFSYLSPEQRVPADHPLRKIREITDHMLQSLSGVFGRRYAQVGRRSIPPEQLCRALLLQVLYTIRSERMLMEQLEYNLLFRWFVHEEPSALLGSGYRLPILPAGGRAGAQFGFDVR